MPAPIGNTNAAKNGSKVNAHRRVVGELGSPFARDVQAARQYRRDLEKVVLARHGEVDVIAAHHIDAAVACEMQASICRWLIRQRLDKMSASDVVACAKGLAGAKESRNRHVAKLRLDPPSEDELIAQLYAPKPSPLLAEIDIPPKPPSTPPDASGDAATDEPPDAGENEHGPEEKRTGPSGGSADPEGQNCPQCGGSGATTGEIPDLDVEISTTCPACASDSDSGPRTEGELP